MRYDRVNYFIYLSVNRYGHHSSQRNSEKGIVFMILHLASKNSRNTKVQQNKVHQTIRVHEPNIIIVNKFLNFFSKDVKKSQSEKLT